MKRHFLDAKKKEDPFHVNRSLPFIFYFKCCRNTFYNYQIFFNRFGASHGILLTKINSSLNEKKTDKMGIQYSKYGCEEKFYCRCKVEYSQRHREWFRLNMAGILNWAMSWEGQGRRENQKSRARKVGTKRGNQEAKRTKEPSSQNS